MVIPSVEMIENAYEEAEEDSSVTNIEYWRTNDFDPFGKELEDIYIQLLRF